VSPIAETALPVPLDLTCAHCHNTFPVSEYTTSPRHKYGLYPWCKQCRSNVARARYYSDPEFHRERASWGALKSRYGLTRETYQELAASQGNVCAICRSPGSQVGRVPLTVDHDHACCPGARSCGRCIRGLLCNRCNRLLGIAADDPDWLLAAIDYLRS
jgi:recombination endonuclease VII